MELQQLLEKHRNSVLPGELLKFACRTNDLALAEASIDYVKHNTYLLSACQWTDSLKVAELLLTKWKFTNATKLLFIEHCFANLERGKYTFHEIIPVVERCLSTIKITDKNIRYLMFLSKTEVFDDLIAKLKWSNDVQQAALRSVQDDATLLKLRPYLTHYTDWFAKVDAGTLSKDEYESATNNKTLFLSPRLYPILRKMYPIEEIFCFVSGTIPDSITRLIFDDLAKTPPYPMRDKQIAFVAEVLAGKKQWYESYQVRCGY